MSNVYVIDGARTPFLKVRGEPGPFRASDLAVYAGRALLARQPFLPNQLDQVIIGCVGPGADEANIGRLIALRLGCGRTVPGWTVQRNCASGMQALDAAAQAIRLGESHLVLAGGTEAMSHAPLLFQIAFVKWLARLQKAPSPIAKALQLLKFRPGFLAPEISLLKALTDPVVNLSMGQTAEEIAYQFHINRTQMDTLAADSHLRVLAAQKAGYFDAEIVPLYGKEGAITQDDGVRTDATLERLGKLRPVFEKYGNITAGNSSQITDGAALLILASEKAVDQYQLPVLGKIVDTHWSGVDPAVMGLGPVHAISSVLQKNQLGLSDMGAVEINEAFAAQVIGCLKAFADPDYCQKELHLAQAFGTCEQLNVDGGAIAMGHPVGASGARLILHILSILARQKSRYGVASLCIGGGQGGAMLVENLKGAA
jgi:acetyl-CoA C-acetyltransferase